MFLDYRDNLLYLHNLVKPEVYVEIGVETGRSLMLAKDTSLAIGVDPEPKISVELSKNIQVFKMTSDDFFKNEAEKTLNGKKIDLAFIDGLHWFEFALRDFINVEKNANKKTIITVHDILPKDEITSRRNRETGFWTGDVYKFVLILRKYRPDLKIFNSDIAPAGLSIITNLDPQSTILEDNYEQIYQDYINYDFANIEANKLEKLNIKRDAYYTNFLDIEYKKLV